MQNCPRHVWFFRHNFFFSRTIRTFFFSETVWKSLLFRAKLVVWGWGGMPRRGSHGASKVVGVPVYPLRASPRCSWLMVFLLTLPTLLVPLLLLLLLLLPLLPLLLLLPLPLLLPLAALPAWLFFCPCHWSCSAQFSARPFPCAGRFCGCPQSSALSDETRSIYKPYFLMQRYILSKTYCYNQTSTFHLC